MRAKAIKCIGAVAEVDSRVLTMPEVQRGVAAALQVRVGADSAPASFGGCGRGMRRKGCCLAAAPAVR